jgi:hypothetical protein
MRRSLFGVATVSNLLIVFAGVINRFYAEDCLGDNPEPAQVGDP